MRKILKLLVFVIIAGIFPFEVFAWQGMPTPPLHVEGRYLMDPTGKKVTLHGWMQPTSNYFNGRFFSDPTTFTPENVEESLNVYKSIVDLLSDTNPLFGFNHGWYNNFVRIWTPSDGWKNDGSVDEALQDRAWRNMYIPYVEHCRARGIYVVFVGNCPDGGTFMSAQHKSNMIKFWTRICNTYPEIKNADNVMFEICNEPVNIESVLGNGNWGSVTEAHDRAVQTYFQGIVDSIRATGANNVIWVPGLIWQDRLLNFAKYPIAGENIGYAGHMYPFGGDNPDEINSRFISSGWKACSDLYPVIVTEGSWHTMGPGQGIRTGTTEGFGITVKNFYDTQGNISWLCGMTEELIGNMAGGISAFTYPEINSGRAGFHWWPDYTWAAPDDGTPKFRDAFVTDNNPKQIQVNISHPAKELSSYDGFTVKIDDQLAEIDSIVLGDTNNLVIYLSESILNNNEILLSYSNGNVVSVYEKELPGFENTLINNLLKGATPRITELTTSDDGNTLLISFNMKMQLPTDLSVLMLDAQYNGAMGITLTQSSFADNDSTLLSFTFSERVYADYDLSLSYSDQSIISAGGGILETFQESPVANKSQGIPVQIENARIEADGISVILEFSKPMSIVVGASASFTIKANGNSLQFNNFSVLNNSIRFNMLDDIRYDDIITVDYTPGAITATDKGPLVGFIDFPVTNLMSEPVWQVIPKRVQAESFYLQSGIQTEQTNDAGGGLNVGWVDSGDWMLYTIENNSPDTKFEVTFRLASPNSDGKFDYFIGSRRAGRISVPNTGGWQSWRSVSQNISIGQGEHYLKVLALEGGFNINYIDIKPVKTGVDIITKPILTIYPNPVSNRIVIESAGFEYNKVEIFDMAGKIVKQHIVDYESELQIPVSLINGMYIVKISNEKQYQYKKIIVL